MKLWIAVAVGYALGVLVGAWPGHSAPKSNSALTIPVTTVKAPPVTTSSLSTFQKLNLTSSQYNNLLIAKRIGAPYNLSLALMGIMWKETRAGKFGPVGNTGASFGERAYGVMQIKLKTAMRVVRHFPKMFPQYQQMLPEQILAKLLDDNTFNVKVALGYCLLLKDHGLTWKQMITAYNVGYEGASNIDPDTHKYTHDIITSVKYGLVAKIAQ